MKVLLAVLLLLAVASGFRNVGRGQSVVGMVSRTSYNRQRVGARGTQIFAAVDGEVEVKGELETSSSDDTTAIPTYLPSDMGIDYVPLATMLSLGDFSGADDFTRDALIKIAGPGAVKRNFVYFTEADKLPSTDLCTMERLWLQFSDGNQGYSVQKRVWDLEKGNFDRFVKRIGWTKKDGDSERLLRWYGQSEFIYDMSAPKGHLPLTSALRGTQLIKKLMEHPVWTEYDWKNYKDLKWSP
jgi:hypothetical protein